MSERLGPALQDLLVHALPDLLDGTAPSVGLSVQVEEIHLDGTPPDRAAAEPRAEDRREELPFDPDEPAGPYTLAWPVLPGPRHVWLVTDDGGRDRLGDEEVRWDEEDLRVFSLELSGSREMSHVRSVAVLARVAVVRVGLTGTRTLVLNLESNDPEELAAAEVLVVGVLALNRQSLIDRSAAIHEDGDYGMEVRLDALTVLHGDRPDERTRRLVLRADLELTATRALREDEGQPIERIASPGAPDERPVAVRIGVDG